MILFFSPFKIKIYAYIYIDLNKIYESLKLKWVKPKPVPVNLEANADPDEPATKMPLIDFYAKRKKMASIQCQLHDVYNLVDFRRYILEIIDDVSIDSAYDWAEHLKNYSVNDLDRMKIGLRN